MTKINSYGVVQSGGIVSFQKYTSQSVSSDQIVWSCNPPAGNVITSRDFLIEVPIRLIITGQVITNNVAFAPPSTLISAGLDAPRCFGLMGATQDMRVQLNNQPVNNQVGDVIHCLARYNVDDRLRNAEFSQMPSYPDQSASLHSLFGTARSPLGGYSNVSQGSPTPNGGFPFTILAGTNAVVTPTTGLGTFATATVDMVQRIPVMVSPMYAGCVEGNTQGFYNLTSCNITQRFKPGGWRFWEHDQLVATSGANQVTSIITSITVQFGNFSAPFSYSANIPTAYFKYLVPNALTRERIGPNLAISYPYSEVKQSINEFPAQTYAQGTVQLTTQNIQLDSIPRYLYVFARIQNAILDTTCNYTDSFYSIENISVTFAAQQVLLSLASKPQLYLMDTYNKGGAFSYQQWAGDLVQNSSFSPPDALPYGAGPGSSLCLAYGYQIQLPEGTSPGVSGQYNLQLTVGIKNPNATGEWDTLPISLYVVNIVEGVFTISGVGSATAQLAPLSSLDVLDATTKPGINFNEVESMGGGRRRHGGDFWSTLSNIGSKIAEHLPAIHKFVKDNKLVSQGLALVPHSGFQAASQLANQFGYGHGGLSVGGCENVNGGIAIQGGKMMTKKQLQKSLGYK